MKLEELIERDPQRLGGSAVFIGTRVPIQVLFERLAAGDTMDAFLDDFPTVSRDQATAVLSAAEESLLGLGLRADRRLKVTKKRVTKKRV